MIFFAFEGPHTTTAVARHCSRYLHHAVPGSPLPLRRPVQVLSEFCLPRQAGEGDVARTLGRLGYKLGYVQDPRRELDLAGARGRAGDGWAGGRSGGLGLLCNSKMRGG